MSELTICLLLVAPVLNGAKTWFIRTIERQSWADKARWFFWSLFAVIAANFMLSVMHMTKMSKKMDEVSDFSIAYRNNALEIERDTFLAGFTLITHIFMVRYYEILAAHNRLEVKYNAMAAQARNAGQSSQMFIDKTTALEAELDQLKKAKQKLREHEEQVQDSENGDKVVGAIRGAKKRLEKAEKENVQRQQEVVDMASDAGSGGAADEELVVEDTVSEKDEKDSSGLSAEAQAKIETLQRQAAAQNKEYMRLMEENEALRTKLEDYELVLGDSRKKKI